MAPDFKSSFIPKGPVTAQAPFAKKKTGIVGMLVILLFILSIFGSVGMYLYKKSVASDIANLQSQMADAEKGIDKDTIKKMYLFGEKLKIVKNIVYKHKVISNFLGELASSTVSTVQFTTFDYGNIRDSGLLVTLHGEAASYASIALQEDVFSKVKYFKSVAFSNLTLASKGLVSFDVAINLDPQISVYSP